MKKDMFSLWHMTDEERKDVVEKFMKLHEPFTEPCEFGYEIEGKTVVFFPKHGDAFYCVEEMVKFADYHNANILFCVRDGKAVARVY